MTYQFKQRRPTQACLPPKSYRRLAAYARSHRSFRITALSVALLVSGCATTTAPNTVFGGARDVPELLPGMPAGYLDDQARPDSMNCFRRPRHPDRRVWLSTRRCAPMRLGCIDLCAGSKPRSIRSTQALSQVVRARAAGTKPTMDCKAEAAALSDT